MTIFYRLGKNLYANITNNCPCACVFCIRNVTDSVGDAPSLWLEREPTLSEILIAYDSRQDLLEVDEVVFCGYGEPMTRAHDVIHIARYIRNNRLPSMSSSPKVRLNTNGLVNFLCPGFDMKELAVFDSISVSLNADDAKEYDRLCKPCFGVGSFDAVVDFAKEARAYCNVVFTVMENLGAARIANCQVLADKINVPLRVRGYM